MTGEFIVTRDGRDTLHDEPSLRHLAEAGMLGADDLVYHPTQGRWLRAADVPEVRDPLARHAALARFAGRVPDLRSNGDAIAGLVLGSLGLVPLLGVVSCIAGICFSVRGLRRADTVGNGSGMAVAGLALSIVLIAPAAVVAVITLALLAW